MIDACATYNLFDYMTPEEVNAIATRRMIAVCLSMGWTYRKIQHDLGVSPQLISKVKKMEQRRGGEQ